ncbi:hypothetical protein ACJQWK_00250 [Exserohilum turcicum]
MAAPDPNPPQSRNKEWLAFHRKHEEDMKSFDRMAQDAHAKLQQKLEKERAELVAKHASEKKAFKTGLNESSNMHDCQANLDRRVVGARSQTVSPTITGVRGEQTSTTTSLNLPADKKASPSVFINLVSDDEETISPQEPSPVQIPSAIRQLYGDCPKTGKPPQIKRTHSLFSQTQSTPFAASHAQPQHGANTAKPSILSSGIFPRAQTTGVPLQAKQTPLEKETQSSTARRPVFKRRSLLDNIDFPRARSLTNHANSSGISGAKKGKRKVWDVSSDDSSDDFPPSGGNDGDDEQETAGEVKRRGINKSKMQGKTKASSPTAKKARMRTLSPLGRNFSGISREKNSFSFHPSPRSNAKVNNQALSSSHGMSPRTAGGHNQPGLLDVPKFTSKKSAGSTATTRLYRKAKLDAHERISHLNQQTATFLAEEESESGTMEEMGSGLRSISLTPRHRITGPFGEKVDMLAETSDDESVKAPGRRRNTKARARALSDEEDGWKSWTELRAKGDRHLAKYQATISDDTYEENDEDEDEDSEPDIKQAEAYTLAKDSRWKSRS